MSDKEKTLRAAPVEKPCQKCQGSGLMAHPSGARAAGETQCDRCDGRRVEPTLSPAQQGYRERAERAEAERDEYKDLVENAMDCNHLSANLQPDDEGDERCIVCAELGAMHEVAAFEKKAAEARIAELEGALRGMRSAYRDQAVTAFQAAADRNADAALSSPMGDEAQKAKQAILEAVLRWAPDCGKAETTALWKLAVEYKSKFVSSPRGGSK